MTRKPQRRQDRTEPYIEDMEEYNGHGLVWVNYPWHEPMAEIILYDDQPDIVRYYISPKFSDTVTYEVSGLSEALEKCMEKWEQGE